MALLLTGTVAISRAQQQPPAQRSNDGSQRGVARLSIVAGDVSIQRGDSGDRSAAAVNAPLMAGDIVAAGPRSRAEIQLDPANVARLASDSEVRLSELTPGRYQLQVGRGTVMFSVVRESHAQVEISTPSVSVRPLKPGAYRVSVFDDGHSEITPRMGEAEIYSPKGTENLQPGNTLMARGDPSDPEFQIVKAIEQDDFDHWNAERDQKLSRQSQSSRYVGPDVDGTQDLDANGRWVNSPDYGGVWTPTVAPDWVPYSNGRWVWEDWYGWTWVSYDPWGWAPFHYGRWFWEPGVGWCWWPGPARSYWSPALVAFFGFGGFHVGIGFGGLGFGWVPLAPFEVFHPWWGHGYYGGYLNRNVMVNNVHVLENVNIASSYRNARIGNGVTAVNGADFARGRITSTMRLSSAQLRSASLVQGQVPIAPTASSLRYSDRPVTSTARSTAFNTNARFFSHNQPAAVNRVPFAQQQQSLSQISRPQSAVQGGRPGTMSSAASAGGWRPAAPAASASSNGGTGGGWRRFGEPSAAGPESRGATLASQSSNGWRTPGDRPATATSSNALRYSSPGYGSQRSLQISPPIVRERSTPGSSGAGHTSSRGSVSSRSSGAVSSAHSSGGGGGGHGHK